MLTVLITGASSGLGLALLKHYASQPSTRIIGLDINAPPPDLSSLQNITFHKIDISSPSALLLISQVLETQGTAIDLLIHSAGIRGLVPEIVKEKKDVTAAETYEVMNHGTMMKALEINTWGTFNVVKSFLPCLLRSTSAPKVIIMSSRMGSISSNTGGGAYAYRASKAALNAIVKSFAVDVPQVVFLMLHPGRVETGLVEWKEDGAFSVDEVLGDCLEMIGKVDKEWSGKFVDRWGKEIGW